MRFVRRLVAAVVVATVGLVLGAAPGLASSTSGRYFQPPAPYHNTYQFDPECDGLHMDVTGASHGVDALLNVPGSHGQAFLLRDAYSYRDVWTNLDTGKSFIVSGHGLFTEIKAVFVPNADVPADLIPPEGLVGPVYRFTATDVGEPFKVTDSRGRTVLRDTGVLVEEYLFDTLGDGEPGGTQLDFRFVKVIGPHPGLDVDVCDLAARLTG
jgi:hypothetical protein